MGNRSSRSIRAARNRRGLRLATAVILTGLVADPAMAQPSTRPLLRIERTVAKAERIQTEADQSLEIILSDGSSIVMGAGAVIQLDYADEGGSGGLRIKLLSGAIRLIVGAASKGNPALIEGGGAIARLTSGGAFAAIEPGGLRVALTLGGPLAVSAGGRTETLLRPGFELLVAARGAPSSPRRQSNGRAYADAAQLNPGLVQKKASPVGTGDEAVATNSGHDETALTRAQVENVKSGPSVQPSFGDTPMVYADAGGLTLGLAATSINPAGGAQSTANATTEVLYAQDKRNLGDGNDLAAEVTRSGDPQFITQLLQRSPGIVSNRILRAGTFDYKLVSGAPAFLKAVAPPNNPNPDLFYVRSAGVIGANNGGTGLELRLTPQFIRVDIPFVLGADISLAGEIFTMIGNEYISKVNPSHIMTVVGGKVFIPSGLPRSETGTFIGAEVFIGGAGAANLRNVALLVPSSAFGSNGAVKTLQLDRRLFFDGMADVTIGRNSTDIPGSTVAFVSDPTNYSYADYLRFVRYEMPGLIDPIGTTANDLFSAYDANNLINLTYTTLRMIDTVDRFQFVQVADSNANLIIHAAGDISDKRSGAFSIDSFVLTRGLLATDLVGGQLPGLEAPAKFRYFLPDSATPKGLALGSIATTPLLILNPAQPSAIKDIKAIIFHADLGLSTDGTISTASLSLGKLVYRSAGLPNPDSNAPEDPDVSRSLLELDGRTIGVSLSPVSGTASAPSGGTVLVKSPLIATAVGGGRVWIGDVSGAGTRTGYAGYLVLENANQVELTNTADAGNAADGGIIDPLGVGETDVSRFGLLRLATGVSTQAARTATAPTGRLSGYVAGAITYEQAGQKNLLTPYLGTIALTLDPAANSVAAQIGYGVTLAGQTLPTAQPTLTLGEGANGGASSFIDANRFGALTSAALATGPVATPSAEAALVSGDAVKAGLAGAKIKQYAHVQWGFFFGDVMPVNGARATTAMSSWVAGQRFTGANAQIGADSAMRGSVSYGGHAIGTVITQQVGADPLLATKVGDFTQLWNLNARTGMMTLNFDGRQFGGIQLSVAGANGLDYGGFSQTAPNNLQAKVSGALVDAPTPTALPGGTIGQFQIRGLDASYQANGTFAGDRTGP
jgi:FecR protein